MVDWVVGLGQEVLKNPATGGGAFKTHSLDGSKLVNVTVWPLITITGLGLRGVVGDREDRQIGQGQVLGSDQSHLEAINKQGREERLNGRRLIGTSREKSLKKEAHIPDWVTRSGRKEDEERMDGADQMKMGYILRANLKRCIQELADGKYLLMEDPNKPVDNRTEELRIQDKQERGAENSVVRIKNNKREALV
ncbi:hypothetical protein PPACK8108_LOCUS1216 [Phakopsora pachyrhizi]|uniref:Uncharacterized protein n=1 Tax=Phakopsora pachyrhizi TaxID=170000 RepID=A0AAV0AGM4_PHAPC|nr:hypothetical protein PPACK8108_LOCUS1216 [Phakopsora pachyrhizi]